MCYHCQFARQFYIGQWYYSTNVELEKVTKQLHEYESDRNLDPNDQGITKELELEKAKKIKHISESRKAFLLAQMDITAASFASVK